MVYEIRVHFYAFPESIIRQNIIDLSCFGVVNRERRTLNRSTRIE